MMYELLTGAGLVFVGFIALLFFVHASARKKL